jgi:uncharacterized protein
MGVELKSWREGQPRIARSVTLQCIGDWGQANFHRICSWLTQEICDRTGPRSRVGIWNTVDGGIDALIAVYNGEVDFCLATPAGALTAALKGTGIFASAGPMPSLRALAVLPQRDRLVLAIAGDLGITNFAELRQRRAPLRIATSIDDRFNLIGYIARRFMEAHGVDEATLRAWGGDYVNSVRPEQSLFRMRDGEVDAVMQEAIMTPGWSEAMVSRKAVALPAEPEALAKLEAEFGWKQAELAAGFLPGQPTAIAALDFADFAVVVRDDMPEDIAHLITWCLVEARNTLERQYMHIPSERSPLTYPMVPARMAQTPLPLHPGARRYYSEAGVLTG